MSVSGWCGHAPPGARLQHEQCRSLVCGCPCHAPDHQKPDEADGGDA